MAWFSSVQANCARDAAIYESLIGFLDSRVDDFGSDDQRVGVSTLAYRFQWFTIPCVHDSQRFLRRLGQFESARRALQSGMASIWDEISWLTS